MTPGRLDLEVPRNGSDERVVQLLTLDGDENEVAIDITDCAIAAVARDIFGGAVVAAATILIVDAAQGKFSMRWVGSQFDALGDVMVAATAAYDVKLTDSSGVPSIPVRGILHITPEATA